jgi:hypothetical protein
MAIGVSEVLVERGLFFRLQLTGRDQRDPFALQLGAHHVPDAVFFRRQLVGALADRGELPLGCHPVRGRLLHLARQLRLQPGYPDHEELVEIRRKNCQELCALVQRHLAVGGLRQHTRVELEPG